ncbi:hypothetical protein DSC45_27960 [Streptomyces sp. YIM 130001]|uniref:hypothetical protein n=1 Tax=Streptomyces sp. YIM 130001 TaxID=2259644 RepID=UPI000E65712A|nr:hypothetical protein [Streptomyces sp. YIM 130001]RII11750.1 hypothetical protein DSC45_27960 [Streptomyces sp. YIM 130001]
MQPPPHSHEFAVAARPGRLRRAWRAAHAPVPGVSRGMRLAACAVPLVVLPSGIWRLPLVADDRVGPGLAVYVVVLTLASELVAFTAFGLIARWGEVFPRWIPLLGGRPVPVLAAVIPAAVGAAALTLLWTVLVLVTQIQGRTIQGDPLPADFPTEQGGLQAAWLYACYAPLTLWGPLMAVLTVGYWKRRRAAASHAPVTA